MSRSDKPRGVRIGDSDWQMIQNAAARSGQTPSEWMRETLIKAASEGTYTRPDFPHNEAELHQFALVLYIVLFLERMAGKMGLEEQLPQIMKEVNVALSDHDLPEFFGRE